MNKDIEIAHKIIDKNYKYNNINYNQIFMWTTENINGIINQINLQNKNILTVCSSGDHIFNFLLEGSNNIVAFDINKLTEYVYELKRAAIITLEYDEFLDFFFKKNILSKKIFNIETYKKIRNNFSDEKFIKFWDELFYNYTPTNLYNSELFIKTYTSKTNIIKFNKYLQSKDNYNLLKLKLKKITDLEFHILNIFKEIPKFEKKFDFIYLSNILDWLYEKNKLVYLRKIKEIVLEFSKIMNNDDSLIGVCYLYCYLDSYWSSIKTNNIQNLVTSYEFNDENYNVINFNGSLIPNSYIEKNKDGLLLYKRKTK